MLFRIPRSWNIEANKVLKDGKAFSVALVQYAPACKSSVILERMCKLVVSRKLFPSECYNFGDLCN